MTRIIEPFEQFFDGDGDPLINGFLKFTESGTNATDKDTFADVNLTIPNTNPVQLDSEGRCPNVFGTGSYRATLFTNDDGSPGIQIDQKDPVGGESGTFTFGDWNTSTTYSLNAIVFFDDYYYRSRTSNNQGNSPSASPTNWEQLDFTHFYNATIEYNENDSVIDLVDGYSYISLVDGNIGNTPSSSPSEWKNQTEINKADIATNTANIATNTADIATNAADIGTNTSDIAALETRYDANNVEKLLTNDTSAAPGTAKIGEGYKGVQSYGETCDADLHFGQSAVGDVNLAKSAANVFVGQDSTGSIEIGSSSGTAASKKLISGAKEATFEDIIDSAGVPTYIHIQDQKTSGTAGGSSTTGSWLVRTLNTVVKNDITGASLSSNQITLPAGDYKISASSPLYKSNEFRIRLYNSTDTAVTLYGTSERSDEADATTARSLINGFFTIAAPKAFQIEYYCNKSAATGGLGVALGQGVEIYTEVMIEKIP